MVTNTPMLYVVEAKTRLPKRKDSATIKLAGVTEVSFRCEANSPLPSSRQREMTLTTLSFACAQKGFGLFSRARRELLAAISDHPWESFRYSRGGIALECTVDSRGYQKSRSLGLVSVTEEDRFFCLDFRLAKEG